jgi:hypothetical protein
LYESNAAFSVVEDDSGIGDTGMFDVEYAFGLFGSKGRL